MADISEEKGNWNETKGILKQKFAMLSDSGMLQSEKRKDEMVGRLQLKLGKTRDEIIKLLSEL